MFYRKIEKTPQPEEQRERSESAKAQTRKRANSEELGLEEHKEDAPAMTSRSCFDGGGGGGTK